MRWLCCTWENFELTTALISELVLLWDLQKPKCLITDTQSSHELDSTEERKWYGIIFVE